MTESTHTLHWDEEGQPISQQFDDIYFSKHNGLDESRYVFIEHNQLVQRFQAIDNDAVFIVGETGFGTGLNFLNCWQHWLAHAPCSAHLHVVSIEKHPLHPNDLDRALSLWPQLSTLVQQLSTQYRRSYTGDRNQTFHYFSFWPSTFDPNY